MKNVVLVLPTYNESGNIEEVIEKIIATTKELKNWNMKILVVDSSSPDGTGKIVKDLQKKYSNLYLLETGKRGLGKAYIEGYQYAFKNLNPYLFFQMDADLSHDPKEILELLKKIEKGADMAVGSRYIKGGSIPADWGIHRKIFSSIGNVVVRLGFMNFKIKDWTGGYRAIKSWVIKNIESKIKNYSGYVFQIAVIDNALKNNAIIKESPIHFKDRKKGVSKINSFQYIFDIFLYIFLNSSFIKYLIVGTSAFIIDFSLASLFVNKFKIPVLWGNTLSMEIAIFYNFILSNFWSFAHKKLNSTFISYFLGFLKFNLSSFGGMLIQLVGIAVLGIFFGKQYWQIYKILLIAFAVIPYSYFVYNKFIWKKK